MSKAAKVVICVFGTIILLIVGTIFYLKIQLVPKNYPDNVQFTIDQGTYGKEVFKNLEEAGIIRNADIDYIYVHFLSSTPIDFKAGTFEIPAGKSLEEIVAYLSDDSKFYRPTETITIPEGEFLESIASTISDKLDVTKDELIQYWDDSEVVKSYMSDYPFLTSEIFNDNIRHKFEGYLFPSTYEFYINSSCDEITRKLLDKTLSIYDKYKDDFNNTPEFFHYYENTTRKATTHEIFTLASILEWESGNDEQMQDVASVFINRFNYPDMIRSSVTACYSQGLDKNSCLLVDNDLKLAYKEDGETYNTYTKFDLPVGPISNPGETAIYSALHPSKTDYYYFVGDICGIDGLTHFSTINENERAAMANKYVACK